MKRKITAIICVISIALATLLSTGASTNQSGVRNTDIFDALETLKYLVDIQPNIAVQLLGKDDITIFDTLGILKGLVGLGEKVKVNIIQKTALCNCGLRECKTEWEPKEYENTTIEREFLNNKVIVVLDKKISAPSKKHAPRFFGNFPIKEVHDLSLQHYLSQDPSGCYYKLTGWKEVEKNNPGYVHAYHQILEITLPIESKQNVLDVVAILENHIGVRSAQPAYIYKTVYD